MRSRPPRSQLQSTGFRQRSQLGFRCRGECRHRDKNQQDRYPAGEAGMSTINGTPGDDTLSTSTSGDSINAGAGNDQVTVVWNVSADGGTGDDLVVVDLHAESRD